MIVLIVGGGGREHAIAACVAKSEKADKIYCAPGNAGTAKIAENVPIYEKGFRRYRAIVRALSDIYSGE